MKLKMVKHWLGEELLTVTLSMHEDKKNPCSEHNHTFEYVDIIKLNSAIKSSAGDEVAKGYAPAIVHRNLKGVKWSANLTALKEAGGQYLDLKKVHNAGIAWKRSNPDVRMKTGRLVWEEQWAECLKSLEGGGDGGSKGEVLVDNITAVRQKDKAISHGTVFARPGESPCFCYFLYDEMG